MTARIASHSSPRRLRWLVPALVCLTSSALAQIERVNLAKLQPVEASSSASGDPALYATDGMVGNGNRWKSDGPAPHWLSVTLPLATELGSAHLYLGRDDIEPVASFSLQSWNGSAWANISVADAIALWPKLEASDVPLVSPAAANAYGGWLGDFYNQAGSRGYRVDYTAVHWYANPDAGGLIGHLQSVYNTWGRPVCTMCWP